MGEIGDAARLTCTAAGDTTDLAHWLAQAAAPGAILISPATRQAVQGKVRLRPYQATLLAEPTQASTAYTVLGLKPWRLLLTTRGIRPLSAFVGREPERTTLSARWRQVEDGRGQVVGIVGEPGMGKSRLVYEFQRTIEGDVPIYLQGRCVSYGQASPYLPLLDVVRQSCSLSASENAASVARRVRQHVGEIGMEPDAHAPYLLHMLGLAEHASELKDVDPRTIRTRTFGALHALLAHRSQQGPLVVEVEDLHWIDPTSEAFLQELVARLVGMSLLLLVTFRPGYQPSWMDKSYATQMALAPLSPEDSRRIVKAAMPTRQMAGSLLQGIIARAGGNPFFLEELARTAGEHNAELSLLSLPDTVRAVLTARMDLLPPQSKQVLQVASVIGSEVPLSLLRLITDCPDMALDAHLRALQSSELLFARGMSPEPTYVFKHALTQEAAYESLLRRTRRQMHRRILGMLERQGDDTASASVDILAHHAQHGQEWDKAVTYFRQAAAKARGQSAYQEAVVFFEQALAAIEHLPQEPARIGQAIDIRLELRPVLVPLGKWEQNLANMREAERLAEALGDQRRLGRIYGSMASILRGMHEYDDALVYCRRTRAIATTLEGVHYQWGFAFTEGQIYADVGDYQRATKCFRRDIASFQGDLLYARFGNISTPSIQARVHLVICLAEIGAFAEGIAIGEEAIRIAETIDRPYERVASYLRMGRLYLRQGDVHNAIPLCERGLTLSREGNVQLFHPIAASYLAAAYARCGRFAESLSHVEQAALRTDRLSFCIEAYFLSGHVETARQLALRTLQRVRNHKERGYEAWVLWRLGEIAMCRDDPEIGQAEGYCREALFLASGLGMRPLTAHAHHSLGVLYRQTGQYDRARCELSAAVALYREMGMTFYRRQAEIKLTESR